MNHEEIENLDRLIRNKEIAIVMTNLLKRPEPDGFTAELYQTFKELIQIILKFFQKIEDKGTIKILFYDSSTTMIPYPVKDATRKVNHSPGSLNIILTNKQGAGG